MGDEVKYTQLFTKPGRKWVVGVSVAALLATGASALYSLKFSAKPPSEPPPTQAEVPAVEAVTALGRIEPKGEVIELSPPPTLGTAKVAQLLVKEGDRVQKGQAVAILDNQIRRLADVEQAQKAIQVAQANLAVVQAGAKTGEIEAQEAAVERLQAQLQGEIAVNQAKVARLQAQRQGEGQAQAATVDRLQAELANAQSEFERYRQLALSGAISASDLDQRRLTLDTTRERLLEAQATDSKTANTLAQQIQEAQAIAAQTEAVLTQQIQEAKANLDRVAEVRFVDVQQAQAEVEQAKAALNQAQADLTLSSVNAPMASQVLKVHTRPGESVGEEGILALGQTDQMMVVAEVSESDINRVRLGQQAVVTSESSAFEGKLEGTVSQIGLQIGKNDVFDTDPAADVDTRVVEVNILLTPEASRRVASLIYSKVIAQILL